MSELHWLAATPGLHVLSVILEFDQAENPFRDAVISQNVQPDAAGILSVPGGPGLGVDVVCEAADTVAADLRRTSTTSSNRTTAPSNDGSHASGIPLFSRR